MVAYALATIATLRAGSRVSYLISHDEIGVMEGPLILPPRTLDSDNNISSFNETDANRNILYELAEAFRFSVHFALAPHMYAPIPSEEDVQASVSNVTNADAYAIKADEFSNHTLGNNVSSSSEFVLPVNSTRVVDAILSERRGKPTSSLLLKQSTFLQQSLQNHRKKIKRFTTRVRDAVLPELWSIGVRTSESISVHLTLASTASSEAYSQSPLLSTPHKSWRKSQQHLILRGNKPAVLPYDTQPPSLFPGTGILTQLQEQVKSSLSTVTSSMFQMYDSLKSINPYGWLNKTWNYWTGIDQDERIFDEAISDTWEEGT